MSVPDVRLLGVEAILAREGIVGRATATGFAGDVATLLVAPEALARLADLAPEIKALGFRYVAIELEPEVDESSVSRDSSSPSICPRASGTGCSGQRASCGARTCPCAGWPPMRCT